MMIEGVSLFLSFMLEQSLLAAMIMLFVIPATFVLRRAYPGFLLVLWLLIPMRLLIPADMVFPFSIIELVRGSFFSEHVQPMGALIDSGDAMWAEVHDSIQSTSGVPKVYMALIFLVWLIGFSYLIAKTAIARLSLHNIVKSAQRIEENDILILLDKIKLVMNCHRNIQIVVSDEFVSTFTIGVANPVICIPSSIYKNANHKSLSAIISHELVHIKNYDDVLINVLNILRCLYFFHPAIWLAQSQIVQQRERLTDLAVVNGGVLTASEYAHSLIHHIESSKASIFSCVHPRIGSQFRFMRIRIEGLVNGSSQENKYYRFFAVALFFVMICTILSLQAGPKWQLLDEGVRAGYPNSTFQSPLKNTRISSMYGIRRHPMTGKEHWHRGVDMPAAVGSPIYAVASGVVLDIKYGENKRPNSIVLLHENTVQSRYFQVGDIAVEIGDSINLGSMIAKIAAPVNGNGPHLHFEIFVEGESVDPTLYIDFSRVAGFKNGFIASAP